MIVADTGPLNYLIQIGHADLLTVLFDQVVIPYEVKEELQHERTPSEVRAWIANHPRWLSVHGPGPRAVTGRGLHAGELAAMDLAEQFGRQMLLIDDQRGRLEAIDRGIPVIGTVGVLYKAAIERMLDFEEHLDKLLRTNFYLSESLRVQYLALWRVWRDGDSRAKG